MLYPIYVKPVSLSTAARKEKMNCFQKNPFKVINLMGKVVKVTERVVTAFIRKNISLERCKFGKIDISNNGDTFIILKFFCVLSNPYQLGK